MKANKKDFDKNLGRLQISISEGDEQAFEELYLYYHKKLISFSMNFTRSKELSEEAVEDVFVRMWCNREDMAGIRNLNVYLYSATKNQSLNCLSKEARRFVCESLDLSDTSSHSGGSSPHDLLVTSEIMQSVQQAIDLLPARCRLIFQMIREDGLRYKDVAEILNISVNTIDAQMAIAVKRLCGALGVQKSQRLLVRSGR